MVGRRPARGNLPPVGRIHTGLRQCFPCPAAAREALSAGRWGGADGPGGPMMGTGSPNWNFNG